MTLMTMVIEAVLCIHIKMIVSIQIKVAIYSVNFLKVCFLFKSFTVLLMTFMIKKAKK